VATQHLPEPIQYSKIPVWAKNAFKYHHETFRGEKQLSLE
jgi:hypothetical protein